MKTAALGFVVAVMLAAFPSTQGASEASGLQLGHQWSLELGGNDTIVSLPALIGTMLVAGTYNICYDFDGGGCYMKKSRLMGIDARSGQVRWQQPSDLPNDRNLATFNGLAVAAKRSANVFALDPATGEGQWGSERVKYRDASTEMLLADEIVFLGGDDEKGNAVFAFSALNGDLLWRAPLPSWARMAPVSYGKSVLIATADGTITSFSKSTGASEWNATAGGKAESAGILLEGDDLFLLLTQPAAVVRFHVPSRTSTIVHELSPAVHGEIWPSEPCLLVLTDGGILLCIERQGGSTLWISKLHPAGDVYPASFGVAVVLETPTHFGRPAVLDYQTGKKVWEARDSVGIPATPFAVANDLYVLSDDVDKFSLNRPDLYPPPSPVAAEPPGGAAKSTPGPSAIWLALIAVAVVARRPAPCRFAG